MSFKKFSNKDFVHLHCHSFFSQFDGLSNHSDLIMEARRMGFPALAITDHGNMMGAIQQLKISKQTKTKKGDIIDLPPIKAIIGSEFYLSRQMDVGQYDGNKKNPLAKIRQPDGRRGNRHLNLYAMNYEGYQNLSMLSQKSWTHGFYSDPRIDIELLSKHCKGLMCGSACLSSVINFNLLNDQYDKAKKICILFKEMFDNNFFLEVMYHGIPEERVIIPDIFKLGKELDIPVVATNDCHYIHKNQARSQEVLMLMSTSRCIKDPKRLRFAFDEFYLKSAQEMGKIFGSRPESLTNSVMMAERINTNDIEKNLFGGMRLPKFEIPKEYNGDAYEYMKKLSWEGMKKLGWDKSSKHMEAFNKELEDIKVAQDINGYDFSTYFLIVRDYVKYAEDNDIMVGAGRGSGFASVILRCLDITYGPDPIEFGFIWERFLGFSSRRFFIPSDLGL